MQLVLVRHAESIWNAEDRWQGQTDVPLSERGRGEADRLAERLASSGEVFDAIVSSDLSRAASTADAVIARLAELGARPPVSRHAGLREMDLGAWCGLPHAEVVTRFAAEVEALQRGDDRPIGGHGESLPGFEARVHEALADVLGPLAGAERVLVVTHGGCIRAVLMRLLGLRGRRRPLEGAGNTSLTTLAVDGGVIGPLLSFNDASHLAGTRAHDGAPSGAATDHELLLGEPGRARVRDVLGLAEAAALAPPDALAETVVAPSARRLVRYAVRPLSPRARPAGA